MTTASNSAILDPVTNPVPTVAPQSKEDTTMSGATNKITALYCRLSQEDARLGESLSIENQKAILLEYAKKNHFPNPVFFVDDGYSGTNYDRPGFQSMLHRVREVVLFGVFQKDDLLRWNLSRGFSAKHNVSENSVQNICRAVSPQRMRIIGSMVFFYL